MVESFEKGGFDSARCEYLSIDNITGNRAEAYGGINHFLQAAKGDYIIICHQDILLLENGIRELDARIRELDALDPHWGVLGNAGINYKNREVLNLTNPNGPVKKGNLPCKVQSLDENFLLFKKSADLRVSRDLSGFHFYGTEACLIAQLLGYTCWVIDFRLHHKSRGSFNVDFYRMYFEVSRKYQRLCKPRLIGTCCAVIPVLTNPLRAQFTFFRFSYKQKKDDPAGFSEFERRFPAERMSSVSYALCWLVYKIWRPFENLLTHVDKRQ